MTKEPSSNKESLDLSELSNFQFGTAWSSSQQRQGRNDHQNRQGRPSGGKRRFNSREQRDNREEGDNRRPRKERGNFVKKPFRPDPVAGVKAEIRAVDSGLAAVAAEIHKHKRIVSMYDLAKLVMAARERYELLFTKEDSALELIHCKKDSSLWLNKQEALQHFSASELYKEFYQQSEQGFVPNREGAQELVLADLDAVVADFDAHTYNDIFVSVERAVVPGSINSRFLSAGLFGLLLKVTENFRHHPAGLIAGLCQAMARHRLPIFKWKGGHHTGPSRLRSIPFDCKLSDRLEQIVAWISQHPGQGTDAMLLELAGPAQGEGENQNHQEWVSDLLWLLEQGYVVVNSQQQAWLAKERQTKEQAEAMQQQNQQPSKKKSKDAAQTQGESAPATVAGEAGPEAAASCEVEGVLEAAEADAAAAPATVAGEAGPEAAACCEVEGVLETAEADAVAAPATVAGEAGPEAAACCEVDGVVEAAEADTAAPAKN